MINIAMRQKLMVTPASRMKAWGANLHGSLIVSPSTSDMVHKCICKMEVAAKMGS